MRGAFLKLKDLFWSSGPAVAQPEGSPFYSASEIASLRQQLRASNEEALAVAKRHGVTTNARVLEIKKRARERATA